MATNVVESNQQSKYKDLENRILSMTRESCGDQNFDGIFGVDRSSDMLKDNIVLPFRFPHLYHKPERAFMLFGVPGCGKSYLLAAAANSAGAKLFVFNLWNLHNKSIVDVPDSAEKCMKTIFKIARDNSPSILCFEEIEVLSGPSNVMEKGKICFVKEMQNFMLNSLDAVDLVVVVGVSQKPWNVDPTVRKMFTWSSDSHVVLPDEDSRFHLLQSLCSKVPNSLLPEDLKILSTRTKGFSGSDISCLMRGAMMRPVRKLSKATHFKKICVETSNASVLENKVRHAEPCSYEKASNSPVAAMSECLEQVMIGSGGNLTECNLQNESGRDRGKVEGAQLSGGSDPHEVFSGSMEDSLAEKFSACDPDDTGAIPMSVFDIPSDKIHLEDLSMQNMEDELSSMKSSIPVEEVEKMLLFETEYCTA